MNNKYAIFNLDRSPFETYSHGYEMAGRKNEWKKLTSIIENYLYRGGCQFIILLGGYGQGKTYTITRVYNKFNEMDPEFPHILVTRTVKGIPLRAQEAEAGRSLFALDLITRIFDNLGQEKMHDIAKGLNSKQLKKLKRRDSRKIFSALGSKDDELVESAFYLLTGNAQSSDTKAVGIGRMISKSPRILGIYYDFLRLIKMKNYQHMLILLDEFEYILDIESKTKISRILATFRIMFDDIGSTYDDRSDDIASLTFVFAISPGGWLRLTDLEKESVKNSGGGGVAPFMQRLRSDGYVILEPFSLEEIKELILIRLQKHRLNQTNENEYYPFTEDAIEFLYIKGNQNPRLVLQLAGIVLDDAIENELKEISSEDTKIILDKYPLPSFSMEE